MNWFVPDHTLAVYVGTSTFDKVQKKNNNGELVSAYPDILQAKKDCDKLRTCLEKYNIKNEDQVYDLSNDPTDTEVEKMFVSITQRLM